MLFLIIERRSPKTVQFLLTSSDNNEILYPDMLVHFVWGAKLSDWQIILASWRPIPKTRVRVDAIGSCSFIVTPRRRNICSNLCFLVLREAPRSRIYRYTPVTHAGSHCRQGEKDLNPQLLVLETKALPLNYLPIIRSRIRS